MMIGRMMRTRTSAEIFTSRDPVGTACSKAVPSWRTRTSERSEIATRESAIYNQGNRSIWKIIRSGSTVLIVVSPDGVRKRIYLSALSTPVELGSQDWRTPAFNLFFISRAKQLGHNGYHIGRYQNIAHGARQRIKLQQSETAPFPTVSSS